MFCSKCGFEISGNDKFCPKCGTNHVKGDNNQEKSININGVEMTAGDMVQYCWDNKMISFLNNPKKLCEGDRKCYEEAFKTIIDEIQTDETPLLCFWGYHNYKALFVQSGWHVYVLTDKRLITAGLSNSSTGVLASCVNVAKILMKKYSKDSVYLRDLLEVHTDMVKSRDVITFRTTKKDFNVMFFNSNVTHQLCDKINATLKQLKEA